MVPDEVIEEVLRASGPRVAAQLRQEREALSRTVKSMLDAAATLDAPGAREPLQCARHLGTRLAGLPVTRATLEGLHAGDLALALACGEGHPGALERFETEVLRRLVPALSRVDPAPAFADEVLQSLRENLLAGSGEAPPRILDYAGVGPLHRWAKVSAVRLALRMRRARGREREADAELLLEEGLFASPELQHAREETRRALRDALTRAIASLPDEDRELLRLHFVERLTLERMGAALGAHKSTLSRRLSAAQALIEKRTRRTLAETLRLSPPELDSLIHAVHSRLDLSLARLLGDTG